MDAYFDPQQSTAFFLAIYKNKCIAYCHMLCDYFYTEMLFDHFDRFQSHTRTHGSIETSKNLALVTFRLVQHLGNAKFS